MDLTFDGVIRIRRYLCKACVRTVSLLPEFALSHLRSSISVIGLFLLARLLQAKPLQAALPPLDHTSEASFGCAASVPKPKPCASRWPD